MKQSRTFKTFLLEYEFHIPKTTYGYWIDSDGQFIVVNPEGHPAALSKQPIFKRARDIEQYKGNMYYYVFDEGWVRIIDIETDYNPKLDVDISIEFSRLTTKSYYALLAFLKDRERRRTNANMVSIFVDSTGTRVQSQHFTSFRSAVRYVNAAWNAQ